MNPEAKRLIITALRSGEYSQTRNCLRSRTGYCAIGVVCDVYKREHPEAGFRWVEAGPFRFMFSRVNKDGQLMQSNWHTAPMEVLDWIGISDSDYEDIMADNDEREFDFDQIAMMIEAL